MSPVRIRSLVAAASLMSLLAACASVPSAPSASLALPSRAPAPIGEYDWHLINGGDETKLVYGQANSDDMPFALSCANRSGRVTLSMPTLDKKARSITLATSEVSQTYSARQEDAIMYDGYLLSAQTSANDAVMQSFARLGWLTVLHEGEWAGLSPQHGTKTKGPDFLAACR